MIPGSSSEDFCTHFRDPKELLIVCPTFFVRPLGRTERSQNIAEANIIDIAVYSSINLYAQLPFLAKLRTKRCRPSFRRNEKSCTPISLMSGYIKNNESGFKNPLRWRQTNATSGFFESKDQEKCPTDRKKSFWALRTVSLKSERVP